MRGADQFLQSAAPECLREPIETESSTDSTIQTSKTHHLCLVAHPTRPDRAELLMLRPYVCLHKGKTLYGWVDENGTPIDNDHLPVTGWANERRVMGFAPV